MSLFGLGKKKEEVKVNKKGKRVSIVTPREKITNIILSIFFIVFLGGGGYLVYYYLHIVNNIDSYNV